MSAVRVLDDADLRRMAPAIFTMEPHIYRSDKYRFVPTIDVVNKLRTEGFLPVQAGQGKSRGQGTAQYARHVIRFRREKDVVMRKRVVGEEVPEIVLLNSHNGGASYQLLAGLFRLVCSNGMVVSSSNFGSLRFKHKGDEDLPSKIIEASYEIIEEVPKVMEQVDAMKSVLVSPRQQAAFATAAIELRKTALDIEPVRLLEARRSEDQPEGRNGERSVWRTFNVVQENLTKGGVEGRSSRGTRRLGAISNLSDDALLNKALWTLADELRKAAA